MAFTDTLIRERDPRNHDAWRSLNHTQREALIGMASNLATAALAAATNTRLERCETYNEEAAMLLRGRLFLSAQEALGIPTSNPVNPALRHAEILREVGALADFTAFSHFADIAPDSLAAQQFNRWVGVIEAAGHEAKLRAQGRSGVQH